MQKIKNLIKNKNFLRGLFAVILVANFGLILDLSASSVNTAQELNFYSVLNADENPQCAIAVNRGIVGGVVNIVTDFTSGVRYSEYIAAQEEICPDQISATSLQKKMESNPGIMNVANNLNNTLLAQRPASGLNYLQEKVYALTNPTTVNAQSTEYYSPGGTGFDLLRPIQAFWSWSVRVVYGVLILLIIAMAFGIMFKSKLPVVGEITIQNAIPAITLAMILVPLSYAISGVFIDVITVGTNAVHQFLIGTPASPGYNIYLESAEAGGDRGYFADDPRVNFMNIRDRINVKEPLTQVFNSTIQNDTTGLVNNGLLTSINTIINSIFNSNPNAADQSKDMTWLGDILQLIVAIASIWISIKIFIRLFKKYLTMILAPITSPFIFATVAIPGNGIKSVMEYVKLLWSCSLFYIVTYLMFLLTVIFTDPTFQAGVPNIASGFFRPPLIGLADLGVNSGNLTVTLFTLIGLGIFFSIPSTLDNIDAALGTNGVMPKFITTPWQSFKDGISFARQSTSVGFRTAGSTFSSAQTGYNTARRAPQNIRSGINRMNATAQNLAQSRLGRGGLTASDAGSWQQRRAAEIQSEKEELERKRNDAVNNKDSRLAATYQRQIDRLDQEAKDKGISDIVAKEASPEEKQSLNASFSNKGQGYFEGPQWIMNTVFVNTLIKSFNSQPTMVYREQKVGLDIEFKNFKLGTNIAPPDLQAGEVNEKPGANLFDTQVAVEHRFETFIARSNENQFKPFGAVNLSAFFANPLVVDFYNKYSSALAPSDFNGFKELINQLEPIKFTSRADKVTDFAAAFFSINNNKISIPLWINIGIGDDVMRLFDTPIVAPAQQGQIISEFYRLLLREVLGTGTYLTEKRVFRYQGALSGTLQLLIKFRQS